MPFIFLLVAVLECCFIVILKAFIIFHVLLFYFFICFYLSVLYTTMVYTLAHALKSKPLCKPLLAANNYEVLLSFYLSLSLFFFCLAKRELLSLHVYLPTLSVVKETAT